MVSNVFKPRPPGRHCLDPDTPIVGRKGVRRQAFHHPSFCFKTKFRKKPCLFFGVNRLNFFYFPGFLFAPGFLMALPDAEIKISLKTFQLFWCLSFLVFSPVTGRILPLLKIRSLKAKPAACTGEPAFYIAPPPDAGFCFAGPSPIPLAIRIASTRFITGPASTMAIRWCSGFV